MTSQHIGVAIVDKEDSVMSHVHADHSLWSDHVAVRGNLDVVRPPATKKTVSFHKFKDLNVEAFSDDISSSSICTAPNDGLNEVTAQYNDETQKLTLRPHAPGFRTLPVMQSVKNDA